MDDLILGIVWYVVFVFSLTCHEAAHAWAAMRGGDLTAYHGGQVSLDPIPHIRREPFGTVLVPIFVFVLNGWMFGWASTPYDPSWAHAHPRRAAVMSLAGPAANLALVLLAVAAIRGGAALGHFVAPESVNFTTITAAAQPGVGDAVATFLSLLFTMNLLLCVFNLIPVPPLDGSGAIGLLVQEDTARRIQEWMQQPALAWGGILVAWLLIPRIFGPVFLTAVNWLYPGVSYGS